MPSATRRAAASTCSPRPGWRRRGHGVGRRRRGRRAPQRRPPPPRQACRRRLRRGRRRGGVGERRAGRPALEALRRRPQRRRPPPACPCAATTSCWPCSARPSTGCPAHEAEAMAEEVGATLRRRRGRRPRPATRWPPVSARCARRCRPSPTRSPRTASPPTRTTAGTARAPTGSADHQRPLPVRHGRHRPPRLCAVDRGMVRGMLTALYGAGADLAVATEASKARGDTVLRHRGLSAV